MEGAWIVANLAHLCSRRGAIPQGIRPGTVVPMPTFVPGRRKSTPIS